MANRNIWITGTPQKFVAIRKILITGILGSIGTI
jgi:hypothetical protein